MSTEQTRPDVAVFIDFENVYVSVREKLDETPDFESIMDRCTDLGRVVIARAYADWYRFPRITSALYANGIEPMYVPTYYYDKEMGRTGRAIKNSVDMNLCIDAMKTLFLNNNIDKFVLITGDRDFIPLVSSIRQQGKEVIIIGIGGAASTHLAQSADEFVFYEQLVGKTPPPAARKSRSKRDTSAASTSTRSEPASEPDIYDTLVEAVHLVRERGYLSTLGSLKLVMKELMGGDFKESRYKDQNGRSFAKFKDFVIEAEKRGKVQIYTSGTVSEVFLPGEDAKKLSQFAELREEPPATETDGVSSTSKTNGQQDQSQGATTSTSQPPPTSSGRSRRRRRPRSQRQETPQPEAVESPAGDTSSQDGKDKRSSGKPGREKKAAAAKQERPPQPEEAKRGAETEPSEQVTGEEQHGVAEPAASAEQHGVAEPAATSEADETGAQEPEAAETIQPEDPGTKPETEPEAHFIFDEESTFQDGDFPVLSNDDSLLFNVGEAITLSQMVESSGQPSDEPDTDEPATESETPAMAEEMSATETGEEVVSSPQHGEPVDASSTEQEAEATSEDEIRAEAEGVSEVVGEVGESAELEPAAVSSDEATPTEASDSGETTEQVSMTESEPPATDTQNGEGNEPEPEKEEIFSDEAWQAFRTMMTQFTKPVSFGQIFDSLRELRKQKTIEGTNEQLRSLVKQAINQGVLERSGRGKRVYYALKQDDAQDSD
jgi:uncharacterized protein (TIGR00288 family)